MKKIKNKYLWNLIVSRGLVSFGAALTGFGLDVWVYELTKSYALFASIAALAALPPLIVSPFAGFLVDRVNKAKILTLCEFGTVFFLIVASVLCKFDQLNVLSVAGVVFGLSVIAEFRYTAVTAIIPMIAEKEELISANGLQQIFRGLTMVCAPFLGAIAYQQLGLGMLLLIAASFGIYAIGASRVLIHVAQHPRRQAIFSIKSFYTDYRQGFEWLKNQEKMKAIVIYFTAINALISLSGVLTTTRVLDLYDANSLALIGSSQGVGMLATGFLLVGVVKRISADLLLLVGSTSLGVAMLAFGVFNNMAIMVISAFCIGASISVVAIANQSIWQACTPTEVHGKMIAIRSMAIYSFVPATLYISTPIFPFFKNVFESARVTTLLGGASTTWQGILQVGLALWVLGSTFLFFYCCAPNRFAVPRGATALEGENEGG